MESLVNLGEAHSLVEPSEAREETHTTVESLVNLGEARILVELSEAREEAHGVPTWSHLTILERHAV